MDQTRFAMAWLKPASDKRCWLPDQTSGGTYVRTMRSIFAFTGALSSSHFARIRFCSAMCSGWLRMNLSHFSNAFSASPLSSSPFIITSRASFSFFCAFSSDTTSVMAESPWDSSCLVSIWQSSSFSFRRFRRPLTVLGAGDAAATPPAAAPPPSLPAPWSSSLSSVDGAGDSDPEEGDKSAFELLLLLLSSAPFFFPLPLLLM